MDGAQAPRSTRARRARSGRREIAWQQCARGDHRPPGARAKLAINLILGINRAALAEGLVFAERMGLAPEAFLRVARASAAYSQVMDVKGGKMVGGDFAPHGFVTQSLKDFSLMAGQARRFKQRLPLAETYIGLMQGCVAAGEGELDNSVVINEIRRRTGS